MSRAPIRVMSRMLLPPRSTLSVSIATTRACKSSPAGGDVGRKSSLGEGSGGIGCPSQIVGDDGQIAHWSTKAMLHHRLERGRQFAQYLSVRRLEPMLPNTDSFLRAANPLPEEAQPRLYETRHVEALRPHP